MWLRYMYSMSPLPPSVKSCWLWQEDKKEKRSWWLRCWSYCLGRGGSSGWKQLAYPDVGVLVVPGEVQHVVQSQHARRNLGEVHSWIHMVLRGKWRRRRRRRRKWVRLGRCWWKTIICTHSFSSLIRNGATNKGSAQKTNRPLAIIH